MPNRILRDWTDSEAIERLSYQAEVFFTRLIMKVDDFGRFPANPRLLSSLLFPLKSSVRDTDSSRWLAECEKSGLVAVYEVKGKSFLEIQNFRQRSRASVSKYPARDGQMTVTCPTPAHVDEDEDVDEGGDDKRRGKPTPFPDSLDTEAFRTAWKDYLSYRAESKLRPLKQASISAKLQEMSEWGEKSAIEAIRSTIANGWQGIFHPSKSQKNKPNLHSKYSNDF
jgi:hypothetical protein